MSLTVQEIKKKLKGYRYGDQTARDIHALNGNFKTLKPQDVAQFINPNGSRENLMCVKGTIPVAIRGVTYNIPIAIWLRLNHPYTCPVVYVTPTHGMGIQQSRFVDNNGTVYLPYLSEWKHGSSDLTTLIQVMCATFVDHCPVYSKPAQPAQPQWQQPPRPVQPPATYQTPYPYQQQPPRPVYTTPQYRSPYPAAGGMPTPYSNYQPPPATGAQHTPYPTSQPSQFPTAYPPTHSASSVPTSSVHSPTLTAGLVGTAALVGTASAVTEESERRESALIQRQSLETAVEDKIRRHVKQVLDAAETEMESMLNTQEKLQKGNKQITLMLEEMENKQREVDGSIDMLQSKNAELESILDYLRSQPDKVDADEAVVATNPLYDQILQLYAEENAIDDTIYYLGEALRKGVIEVEVFLKHVRELSRQQFMARATIMKARSSAGLPSHGMQ